MSIYQPHVRPIPRGKTKAQIEFGPKLGASLDKDFARINTFSWDAYHEAGDLIPQVEDYKVLHRHYPELVLVDQIYTTRENRRWLKERGIRITAPPMDARKRRQTRTIIRKVKLGKRPLIGIKLRVSSDKERTATT